MTEFVEYLINIASYIYTTLNQIEQFPLDRPN